MDFTEVNTDNNGRFISVNSNLHITNSKIFHVFIGVYILEYIKLKLDKYCRWINQLRYEEVKKTRFGQRKLKVPSHQSIQRQQQVLQR